MLIPNQPPPVPFLRSFFPVLFSRNVSGWLARNRGLVTVRNPGTHQSSNMYCIYLLLRLCRQLCLHQARRYNYPGARRRRATKWSKPPSPPLSLSPRTITKSRLTRIGTERANTTEIAKRKKKKTDKVGAGSQMRFCAIIAQHFFFPNERG